MAARIPHGAGGLKAGGVGAGVRHGACEPPLAAERPAAVGRDTARERSDRQERGASMRSMAEDRECRLLYAATESGAPAEAQEVSELHAGEDGCGGGPIAATGPVHEDRDQGNRDLNEDVPAQACLLS